MPVFLIPMLTGATGLGLGFWAADGFSSLLKIVFALIASYLFYIYVIA